MSSRAALRTSQRHTGSPQRQVQQRVVQAPQQMRQLTGGQSDLFPGAHLFHLLETLGRKLCERRVPHRVCLTFERAEGEGGHLPLRLHRGAGVAEPELQEVLAGPGHQQGAAQVDLLQLYSLGLLPQQPLLGLAQLLLGRLHGFPRLRHLLLQTLEAALLLLHGPLGLRSLQVHEPLVLFRVLDDLLLHLAESLSGAVEIAPVVLVPLQCPAAVQRLLEPATGLLHRVDLGARL
mmetsp:Transcript_16289/g.38694  ORF Transcript_16289/g.38694 Transcript_16289/m.38694 type:complete len:234 (-) Transcript_16289:651-1352(-)